jgi:hypothetical protein
MRNLKTILAILITAMLSLNCKKQEQSAPCNGQLPFKTDFGIYIKALYSPAVSHDTLIELNDKDTCLGGYLNFVVKESPLYNTSFDSLRWIVGNSQNTSTQRAYQLAFGMPETGIEVQLTGYKRNTALNCFPGVPDIQTVKKTFSVVAPDNNIPITGSFFGYNTDNPADTFTITIRFEPDRNWLVVKNFPKGNMGYPYGILPPSIQAYVGIAPKFYGYNYILFDNENGSVSTPGFGPLNGIAKVTGRNQVEINYQQFMTKDALGSWTNPKQRKFTGVRK